MIPLTLAAGCRTGSPIGASRPGTPAPARSGIGAAATRLGIVVRLGCVERVRGQTAVAEVPCASRLDDVDAVLDTPWAASVGGWIDAETVTFAVDWALVPAATKQQLREGWRIKFAGREIAWTPQDEVLDRIVTELSSTSPAMSVAWAEVTSTGLVLRLGCFERVAGETAPRETACASSLGALGVTLHTPWGAEVEARIGAAQNATFPIDWASVDVTKQRLRSGWRITLQEREIVWSPGDLVEAMSSPTDDVPVVAAPRHRSERTALALSAGVTLGGVALIGLAMLVAAEDADRAADVAADFAAVIGSLASLAGPTVGHAYAGDTWNRWLALRTAGLLLFGVGGAYVLVLGEAISARQTPEHPLFVSFALVGAAVYTIGSLIEIATAPRAARRFNRR